MAQPAMTALLVLAPAATAVAKGRGRADLSQHHIKEAIRTNRARRRNSRRAGEADARPDRVREAAWAHENGWAHEAGRADVQPTG